MTRLVWTSCCLYLAACSGSDLEPGAGNDLGDGTGTLVVDGSASADPAIDNATGAASFTTDFSIQITRGGAEVRTGTVDVHSTAGSVALLYDTSTNRWRGAQAGYFEVYALDVTSDEDFVHGVRVDGPDIHSFTEPMRGATVDSELPLQVAWIRDDAAESATFRTRDIDVSIEDGGSYSLAPGSLRSKPDQTEDERIELTRSQRVMPAGGAVGSSFRVSVKNRIDLVVRATQ